MASARSHNSPRRCRRPRGQSQPPISSMKAEHNISCQSAPWRQNSTSAANQLHEGRTQHLLDLRCLRSSSGAREKMLFISLVNLLSVFHKSLKQSTPLANLHHLQHEGFLVGQLVKNPPAMWKTWVRSLGWEDPLDKGKATHSSILALENFMDHMVHGLTKSRTWLSDLQFHFQHD